MDTVEAALARCKSPPQSSSSRAAPADNSDPRVAGKAGGTAKHAKFAKIQQQQQQQSAAKMHSTANGVVAGGGSAPAAEQQQPKQGGGAGKPAAAGIAAAPASASAAATTTTGAATDASLSTVRRWPSPDESAAHPLWKMPPPTAPTPGQRNLPEPTDQTPPQQLPGRNHPGPTFGAAVAPPMTSAAAAVAAAAASAAVGVGPSGRGDGGVRSPSLMGLGSPRPPGTFVSRRREARRELAVNDADERMSWSSFDSLDVRVDDQV